MKSILIALVLLSVATIARADGYNNPPQQDSLDVTYGDICSAQMACDWYENWSIIAPVGTLSMWGREFPISPIGIDNPAPGFGYSSLIVLTDLFDVNAACDAAGNELVCDEQILGLYNGGFAIDPTTLPYYQTVLDADPAPLEAVATPEPSLLSLLTVGVFSIICLRKLCSLYSQSFLC